MESPNCSCTAVATHADVILYYCWSFISSCFPPALFRTGTSKTARHLRLMHDIRLNKLGAGGAKNKELHFKLLS
jgi:hypothetical protein